MPLSPLARRLLAAPPTRQKTAAAAAKGARPPASFLDFAQATLPFALHSWQERHLCPLLQRFRHERGLRVLIHAPPQYGKSILVSQRFPSWLLGEDPTHRLGLVCYNETHAASFGAVVRDLMASDEYAEMYPASIVSKNASAKEFSTAPRRDMRDAQASFRAFGLLSGLVGRGPQTLIVDDPYASAAAAASDLINASIRRLWNQTVKPRVFAETNVLVMFHRYHDQDFGGFLMKEGGWEYIRFPALADENEDRSDPTGRAPGEPLSPRRSVEDLRRFEAADAFTFAGQFQGRPRPEKGGFFQVQNIAILTGAPANILDACRAWDIAATVGGGDYTAGIRMGRRANGKFTIVDVEILQEGPEAVDRLIEQCARVDGSGVRIHLAQDPGSAGKRDASALARRLAGSPVEIERVSGSKESRARNYASQVNLGNVEIVNQPEKIVRTGPHAGLNVTEAFLAMHRNFPVGSAKKDAVDAASDAFNVVALAYREVGSEGVG